MLALQAGYIDAIILRNMLRKVVPNRYDMRDKARIFKIISKPTVNPADRIAANTPKKNPMIPPAAP